MADTPGKILSSFNTYTHEKRMSTSSSSSGSGSSSGIHSGGCSGIFFEILDRFHHKGFIPHKLLPAARPKPIGKIEKLPMAKLLLIADENRIGSSLRSDRGVEDECVIKHEEKAQISSTATATATTSAPMATSTRSLSIVARLMGLETIPSSPSIHEENHHHPIDLGSKNYNGKCIVNTHIEHCFPMLPKKNRDEEEGKQLDHIMMESMSTCSTDAAEQNDKLGDEATIPCRESKRSIEDEKSLFLSNLPPLSLATRFDTQQFSSSKVSNHHPNNDFSSPVKSSRGVRIGGKEKAEKSEEVVDNNRQIIRSRRDKRLGKKEEDSMHNVRGEGRILSPSHGGKSKGEGFQSMEQSTLPNISIRSRYATTKETTLSSGRESVAKQSISSSSSSSAPHKNSTSSSLSQRMPKPPSGSMGQREKKQPADTVNEGISKNRRKSGQHNSIRSEHISSLTVGVQDVCAMKHRGPRSDDGHESQTSKRMSIRIMSKHEHVSQSNTQVTKKHPTIPSAMSISSFTDALSSSSLSSSLCSQESVVSDAKKCSKVKTLKPSHRGPSSCSQSTTISKGSSSMKRVPNETTDMALSTQCSSGTGERKERKCNEGIMTSSASESDCAPYCEHEMKQSRGCKWENVTLLRVSTCEVQSEDLCVDNNGISSSMETSSSSSSCMEDTNTTIETTPRTPSSKDSDSTLDSFCGEECGQPSPISTLDFPPDASSNCSDTCDTPRGKKQGYLFECIGIARRTHVDDEESSESGSMIVGGHDKLPITDDSCHPHLPCHASVNAECRRKQINNEKDYVNEIIEEATVYAEKVLSGRLALLSDLINPTLFIKLEEQTKYSDWWEHPREKQEEDDDLSTHELQCGVSRGKSALYRRKLVFDCINEALRCKLDMVTKQSFYLFAPSLSILVNLSVPKILDGVCKQINEWNRIAMNRYMDDMMKREINDTLGWGWSTSGHEMDVILINIEDFILGDLVGETIKLLLNM